MKKKIAALVLAATLVTGMGGYGTYSYFRDEADFTQNISITTGTLDISTSSSKWETKAIELNMNNKDVTENEVEEILAEERITIGQITTTDNVNALTAVNVKPGDYFTRKITISNDGTLDANVKVSIKDLTDSNLNLSIDEVSGIKGIREKNIPVQENGIIEVKMPAGSSFVVKLKLEVSTELTNENAKDIENVLINDNVELLKVKAEQLGVADSDSILK